MRTAAHPIVPLILNRWSPRAMSGAPLSDAELKSLFEAARWAPSCFNDQPWVFLYARTGTPQWPRFFGLLAESNQVWCQRAAVLAVVCTRKNFAYNGKPNRTAPFDCGSAWENLALQASSMNLVAHGMAGFDYDRAATELGVPDDHAVLAMFALGRPGKVEDLPEKLRAREVPSDRKPIEEFVREGGFRPQGPAR